MPLKQHNKYKTLIFRFLTIVIPFAILFLIELSLRFSGIGDDLSLFVPSQQKGYENYLKVNPLIGKKYFQTFHHTTPTNDLFLKEKKANSFRVFVMGSSTIHGYPYGHNLMSSRILHKRIEQAFPNKHIEVVNTAISAINSFTLLDFTDEIIEQNPDAVIIYAGHNEFYGAFGVGSNETMSKAKWLTNMHLKLMSLKTYQFLRATIAKALGGTKPANKKERGTLMKRIVGNNKIFLNSPDYNTTMTRYKQNMSQILRKYKKNDIPVFYSELISNIGDLEPFNSLATPNLQAANDVFNQAKASQSNKKYKEARVLYEKACDLDLVRFRASSDVNKIISTLCADYNAQLIPMQQQFINNTKNGIVGSNLVIDHVHPNISGQFIMADAFFNSVVNSGLLKESPKTTILPIETFKVSYGYTKLDSLVAEHKIMNLKSFWPFVKESSKQKLYSDNYVPTCHTDSLAFLITNNKNIWISDVRYKLASNYLRNKNYPKAFNEFNAMVYSNPYKAVNYTDAAFCLIQLHNFSKALLYYKTSLLYDKSFKVHYKMGELYLLENDLKKAANSFKLAYEHAPKNNEIYKYAKTYSALIDKGEVEYAKEIAAELVKVKLR